MSRKVICKACKSKLTTETAYKITNGKVNNYYCSKEEYDNYIEEINIKNKCFNTIAGILDIPFVTPMMRKEVIQINEHYNYIVIEKAFKENENNIKWFLENKDIGSEYSKAKYIITIIKNNINLSYKKYIQEQKEIEKLFIKSNRDNVDIDIMNIDKMPQTSNKTNDISSFLD